MKLIRKLIRRAERYLRSRRVHRVSVRAEPFPPAHIIERQAESMVSNMFLEHQLRTAVRDAIDRSTDVRIRRLKLRAGDHSALQQCDAALDAIRSDLETKLRSMGATVCPVI